MIPRVYQAEDGTVFVEDRPYSPHIPLFKVVHLGPKAVELGWWTGELVTEESLKCFRPMVIQELKAERPWS